MQLHPELEVTITVNVARSADEAERLARGEDVTIRREGGVEEDEAEAAQAAAQAMFEPGTAETAEGTGEAEAPAAEASAEARPKARKGKAEKADAE